MELEKLIQETKESELYFWKNLDLKKINIIINYIINN